MTVQFLRADRLVAMHRSELSTNAKIEILAYPLTSEAQSELIQLLRTEWTQTDYDWIEAMHGDYSADLVITSIIVRIQGAAVATATIHFSRRRPEVAVLGSVLTLPGHRDRGLAGRAIDQAMALAADAGCRVCLLGTTMRPQNLYHYHGFTWQLDGGVVMRRDFNGTTLERDYFAPGQSVVCRAATWGDLPGLSLLLAQPLAIACPDYLRGLMSGRFAPAERCLSNFPVLWYDTVARNGLLQMLAAPDTGRIFGFGSVTPAPGPARRHMVTVDFAAHENAAEYLPALLARLLDGCRSQGIRQVRAYVAEIDALKINCVHGHGFRETARLSAALHLGGAFRDVLVFEKQL